jgi:hypothetical protein
MNRFVLTDEEDAEYCSFECLLASHDTFRLSKVLLCTSMQFGNLSSRMYVNSHMHTNPVYKQGVPICKFLGLNPRICWLPN